MESPITAIRPSTSHESLTAIDGPEIDQSPLTESIENSTLNDTNEVPLTQAPRPRAETAASDTLRELFIAPEERLKKLNDDIQKTLAVFEDCAHPRLPDCVYDGLRKCATELESLMSFHQEPHILQMDELDTAGFEPEPSMNTAQSEYTAETKNPAPELANSTQKPE